MCFLKTSFYILPFFDVLIIFVSWNYFLKSLKLRHLNLLHIHLSGNDIGDQAGAQLRYLVNLLFKITNRYIVFRYFLIQIFSNLALLVHRNDEQANFDKVGEA